MATVNDKLHDVADSIRRLVESQGTYEPNVSDVNIHFDRKGWATVTIKSTQKYFISEAVEK